MNKKIVLIYEVIFSQGGYKRCAKYLKKHHKPVFNGHMKALLMEKIS
jgi:hypothetical protein